MDNPQIIWVVETCWDYEGGYIVGIWDTKEAAEAQCAGIVDGCDSVDVTAVILNSDKVLNEHGWIQEIPR